MTKLTSEQKYVRCPFCNANLEVKDNEELNSYMCPKCDNIFSSSAFLKAKECSFSWKDMILPIWLYIMSFSFFAIFIADVCRCVYRLIFHVQASQSADIEIIFMYFLTPLCYGLGRYFSKKLKL